MQNKCHETSCQEKPLSLADHCWNHIPDRDYYIRTIEDHVTAGKSLEGFNFKGLKAPSMSFLRANCKGANFSHASLRGAIFSDANISEADFIGADVSQGEFIGADCIKTNFMLADVSHAHFWHADMSGVDLAEAKAQGADFLNAVLCGANLYHADLKEARFLASENFRQAGCREGVDERGFKTARESYANLKQYFITTARYNDVSWASYNENRMELRRLWKERRPGLFPFFIMGLLCGWGERPLRSTVSAVSIITGYAAAYFSLQSITSSMPGTYTPGFWDYVYYSTITFTTVGYGDFVPKAAAAYKLLAGSEAFIGIFMMGLFVFSLGRRYSSR